jgi:guanylate kinase
MMKTKRFILVGPAASGKDFMRKRLEARGLTYAVSYTTRPPRDGEVDGKDYFFISDEVAAQMIERGEFYEWTRFNDWVYGITLEQMERDSIFIMTPRVLSKIKPEDRAESLVFFFDIPEKIRAWRLATREMPGDTPVRRLKADRADFKNFKDWDIRISNSDF